MSVRTATEADVEAIQRLYREFFAEWPPPPYYGADVEEELAEVAEIVQSEIAVVAERGGEVVGFALARRRPGTRAHLTDIYLRPAARHAGLGAELMGAVAQALRGHGVTHMTLVVNAANASARAAYERWGFREQSLVLGTALDELEGRLAQREPEPSFGSVHVQTDDATPVERAVRTFVPRLGHSEGTVVSEPRNGWIAVYDELCDRDPAMLRRLARELSDRLGAVVLSLGVEDGEVVRYVLLDRGRIVDEYLSVPEYHGPLPPGDVVAMGANPTAVSRLTGADPQVVRAVARTASSPGDLPRARDLLRQIAEALGLEGGDVGYAEAAQSPPA